MKIQNNITAMNANRILGVNKSKTAKTLEKLSSGYRINRSADDAAGLAVSEKMRSMINGLTQAEKNCHDAVSLVQTAEGALNEVHAMLQRMSELANQAANGSYDDGVDRASLQLEFSQIQDEIDHIAEHTDFNGMNLFDGTGGTTHIIGKPITDGSTANSSNTANNATNNTNNTTNSNTTNNSNTPSVTNLDDTQQQAPVMRTMSLRSVARAVSSITVGAFTLTGDNLTEGTDYSYSGTTLTILSDKAITISGTTTTDHITIKSGIEANVTLSGANIDLSSEWFVAPILVDGTAKLNLTLAGENTLVGGGNCAGLQVADNATLVIDGQGELYATNGLNVGAGIGGGHEGTGGTIIINGGTITAIGGQYSAGIGSGADATSAGSIMINDGTINATGGEGGAGIGGGYKGSGGDIDINGGTVTATGGAYAAGIGGGDRGSSGGNIDISGGTVTATGGFEGSGIGGGVEGDGGNIVIDGGNVTATGGDWAAGIGGGSKGDGGKIEISGGTVNATGGSGAAAIGDGQNGSGGTFSTGTNGTADITVSNTDGDTEIADLISDTSGIDVWSATTNGVQYPKPLEGTGNIDLSTLTDDLVITDGGYKIGDKTYTYSGDYTFTGTTDKNITVSNGGTTNISLDGATLGEFAVKGNSTVNMNVTGENTAEYVHVENGSKLNITGDGTLNTNQGIGNKGTLTNDSTINNDGLLDNEGTLTNGENGTINNGFAITNKGSITNNGDINNESGSTINNNTGGTITNNGDISNAAKGNIENSGDINNENSGSISNSGAVTNKSGGEISNSGDVTNNVSGTIANSGNITNENSGSISNSGEVTNKSGGTVENAGSVTNNDGGTIDNSGTITNSGEITNASGGTIDNNGNIDSTGGTLTNNGEIKSRPDSNIDGTVSGTQPTDAPAKADGEDDEDGDFEDGENIWIMQVGGRSKDTFVMDIGRMNTKILGVHKDDINISTQMNANRAIDVIGEAVNKLSLQRADIGAYQNRLEHKIDNLNVTRENLISSESKIRDTDMAVYMMEFTKNQILNNAAQAMLAQANSLPQSVLSLIQ